MAHSQLPSIVHFRRLLVTLGALAVVSSPVSAQLGKLKKVATDAAKDAAGVKKPETPAAAGSDYTLTAERIDAVLAVLEPDVDRMLKELTDKRTRDEIKADYEKKQKAFSSCLETGGKGKAPDVNTANRAGELGMKLTPFLELLPTLVQNAKWHQAVAVQDTVLVLQMDVAAATFGLEAKCGRLPFKPKLMLDDEERSLANNGQSSPKSGSKPLKVPSDKRVGMTVQQFGVVRERMAVWAMQQAKLAPVTTGTSNKYAVFTDAEQALMEARADRLKRMAPLFKDGLMNWSSWGDMESW